MMEVEAVLDDWPEAFRKRKWMAVEEAVGLVEEEGPRRLPRPGIPALGHLTTRQGEPARASRF